MHSSMRMRSQKTSQVCSNFLSNRLTEVCEALEKLSRMWPEIAADKVQEILSPHIYSAGIPWEEIKENVKQGNVIGSGYGYTLLHLFVKEGTESAVKLLVENGADINAKTKLESTPLHLAIEAGNESLVRYLLKQKGELLTDGADGMKAWGLAYTLNNETLVRILAEHVDITGRAVAGKTPAKPLMLAIERGNESFFRFLVQNGADIEARDESGATALIKAVECKRLNMVKYLLHLKKRAEINATTKLGVTPLIAAARAELTEIVELLLKARPNIEARDKNEDTALLVAARQGSRDIVKLLLSHNADCRLGYPPRGTPQHVATDYEVIEILQNVRIKRKGLFRRLASAVYSDELDQQFEEARWKHLYGGNVPEPESDFRYHRHAKKQP